MYDVIVIGARCAGAPTAMLLARRGYKVLLVDKVNFPRDTVSTHYIHQVGIRYLENWKVLPALIRSGCPKIHSVSLYSGSTSLNSMAMGFAEVGASYCPRRTILDALLAEAAAAAGAELREQFPVESLLLNHRDVVCGVVSRGRSKTPIQERARLIIGADGVNSLVARTVKARLYDVFPTQNTYAYTYWSGVSLADGEIHWRKGLAATAFPTHEGMTCVTVVWPRSLARRMRSNLGANYLKSIDMFPRLSTHVRQGRQEEPLRCTTGQFPNFFRVPYGCGWALVGDAGYHKDPITAFGISDAFRDADFLAESIGRGFSGRESLSGALAAYERRRNEVAKPLYQFTLEVESLGVGTRHRGDRAVVGDTRSQRMHAAHILYLPK